MGGRGGSAGLGGWATPDCNTSTYSNGKMGPNIREQASQWLTPNVPNGGRSVPEALVQSKGMTEDGEKRTVGLESQVRYWATPTSNEHTGAGHPDSKQGALNLRSQVGMWPTPAARDHKGANSEQHATVTGGGRKHMDQLANFVAFSPLAQVTRDGPESLPASLGSLQPSTKRLNPYFAERLMGWPLGWTLATEHSASSVLEMELCHFKLQQHLSCLLGEQGL
jgi:hypothetical protein